MRNNKIDLVVRWMGAFGHHGTLQQSLEWELANCDREVAAEPIRFNGWDANIRQSSVGLIVAKGAIVKAYNGDVWSMISGVSGNRLKATRYGRNNGHAEAFCRPQYNGIVVRGSWEHMKSHIRGQILEVARKHKLAIYTLGWNEQQGWNLNCYRRFA